MVSSIPRVVLVWVVLAGAMPAAAQKIYKWVDAEGRTQYTQTPPPNGAKATETEMTPSGPSALRQEYCKAIRDVAREVATWKAQGAPLAAVHDELASIELRYDVDVSTLAMREVANYVYNAGQGRSVDTQMTTRVYNACIGGSFGNFAMKSKKPGTEGDQDVESGPHGEYKTGTGWVTNGLVATNHHVIKGSKLLFVVLNDGRRLPAKVDTVDSENDVALLQVTGSLPPGLPLSSSESGMGADVFTLGYPHTDIMGKNAKLSTGVVSATTGMGDDPRFYQISVPVQSGNSGGPLLNKRGEVVGLVTAKLSAETVFRHTGDLPQNVNYAVKVAHLKALIGIPTKSQQVASGEASLEALAKRISPSVVFIIAE